MAWYKQLNLKWPQKHDLRAELFTRKGRVSHVEIPRSSAATRWWNFFD